MADIGTARIRLEAAVERLAAAISTRPRPRRAESSPAETADTASADAVECGRLRGELAAMNASHGQLLALTDEVGHQLDDAIARLDRLTAG